jgi:hypothetical protein
MDFKIFNLAGIEEGSCIVTTATNDDIVQINYLKAYTFAVKKLQGTLA